MKFKKIMLVTIVLLAILTMGAVSASEDVASDDDGLAVIDGDASIDAPVDEVKTDDVLSSPYEENSFDPIFEDEAYLESDKAIVDINTPDEGNFSISVDNGAETNVLNHEINEDDVDEGYIQWTLEDLEITEPGTYFITAKYISPSGDETTIFDGYELLVLPGEGPDDSEDGVVIWVPNGDEKEFDVTNEEDLDAPFALISVSNEFSQGNIIRIWDEDENDDGGRIFFEKSLSEITNTRPDDDYENFTIYLISLSDFGDSLEDFLISKHLKIEFFDVDENDEYDEIDSRSYQVDYDDESIVKFWEIDDEDDEEDDAEDGVVIWVPDGEDKEFDVTNEGDLNEPFAFVSVQNDLYGRIVFMVWSDEEDEEQVQFSFNLEDITNKEDDPENEGFTIYKLSLNDLKEYDDLIDCESFRIVFFDDEGEVDSRKYYIDYDGDIVKFWEADDEDEDRGEFLETIIFINGNAITNDIIIYIPKAGIPDDVDDEFEVIVKFEDEEISNKFKLSELDSTDQDYFLRVLDLFELDDVGETYGYNCIIQFYKDGENAYYATSDEDHECIYVYTSPYINEVAYLLNDDFVISFRGFDSVDDEFMVIISHEGENNVKTFKISELGNIGDEFSFYEIHASDLGITEAGEYVISVNFTDHGEHLAYNEGNVTVDAVEIWSHEYDDYDNLVVFDAIDQLVFNVRVNEDVSGFVMVYVNGNPVGDYISFADLGVGIVPPSDGRKIVLNNLNITQSGDYTVKLEVFDENKNFLTDKEIELRVEVGDNRVVFMDGAYGSEACDIINFIISTPLSSGQYYTVYFNGKKAGNFTAENGLVLSDEFVDEVLDVKFVKPGDYAVNVTFFDSENENDFDSGSISIKSLNLTANKEIYLYEVDSILISAELEIIEGYQLEVHYVIDWGPVGRESFMVFNPIEEEELRELYNDGVVTFDAVWFIDDEGPSYRYNQGINYIYISYGPHHDAVFAGLIVINVVDPELDIIVDDIDEGEDAFIEITTVDTFSGTVIVEIDDDEYNVDVNEGYGNTTVSGLGNGRYTAIARFAEAYSPDLGKARDDFTVGYVDPNDGAEYIFITYDGVDPWFDVNTETNVEGYLYLIEDGVEKRNWNLRDIEEYGDEDGRWHHGIHIDAYILDEGDHEITLVYEDDNGQEMERRTYDITVEYNPNAGYEYILLNSESTVNPEFDINTETNVLGRLVLIEDGEEKHVWNLRDIAEYGDEDERWHHGIYIDSTILDEGIHNITLVYEDGNGVVVESRNIEVEIVEELGNPEIFVMWSDWPVFEKVEYDLDSTDMIHIYLNDDDSELSDIRIAVKIGDTVYLNATLAELNLDPNVNNYDKTYYTIGPAHFTLAIAPGHYDNVIAYYYSPKYDIASDEGLNPNYANLFGDSSVTFDDIEYTYGDNGATTMAIDGATVSLENISVDNHPEAQIALQDNVITVSGLAVGNYILKVVTTPINEYYRSVEASANITVKPKPIIPVSPNLDIAPVSDVEEGSDVVISISARDNFTGSVKVLVGDVEVGTADVVAGSGTFTIAADKLAVGANTVKVVSDANENFTAGNANVTVTVKEKVVPPVVLIDPNLTISVDDIREGTYAVVTITTNSTFSGNVKVQIGTDNHTVPVTNGMGSINVPGLAAGNYTAIATFEATETFNASTKNATFKVNKATVPDPETAISTDSGSTGPNPVYSINLGPDATGTFSVKIGDKVYTEELKGGAATIEVTDLPAGTYEAVISYSGDAKYAPISKTVNATVKAGTVIKATAVTTTYGTSKNIVITLTDANGNVLAGKEVIVVLNGAKKVLTTDANGKASYAVGNKLAVKTFVASITFEGDANYVKSTGSAKIVVKKATPKLTAKKKTFKVKKAKKYSIVLKTDKGKALAKVKVTLTGKFKGKKIKITAKTNSRGKATFNLKKLTKKGKFTATVKFAGNKYYNAATKKVKITIK